MQRFELIAVALGCSIVLVAKAWGGVVMSETSVATSPAGTTTQHRTIYVQGNKQKVERPGVDSITDLDKGVVYVVDKQQKRYLEMPVASSRLDQARRQPSLVKHYCEAGQ